MAELPDNFLTLIEFLPDGSHTSDPKIWLKAWGEFTSQQILCGKINVYEIPGFNEETGEVPNQFIKELYLKERRPH